MQEQGFRELESRASAMVGHTDELRRLEATTHVRDEIERMKQQGEALVLTDEEERMLGAFRRFKLRMRKNGEVFKWQTCRPEGVQIARDTSLIILPQEVL